MDAARIAPASGKNGTGPRLCTTNAANAAETGKTPKLASISSPVRRPSMPGGAQRWKAVIITTLPKPFMAP